MIDQLINSVRVIQNVCEAMDCQLIDFEYDAEKADEVKVTFRLPIQEGFKIIPKWDSSKQNN